MDNRHLDCHLDSYQFPPSPRLGEMLLASNLLLIHPGTESTLNPEYFKASKATIFLDDIPTQSAVLLYCMEDSSHNTDVKYAQHKNKVLQKGSCKKPYITEKRRQIQSTYSSCTTFKI